MVATVRVEIFLTFFVCPNFRIADSLQSFGIPSYFVELSGWCGNAPGKAGEYTRQTLNRTERRV